MDKKPILYIDTDNVLVDFKTGIDKLTEEEKIKYEGRYDETPDIFSKMLPMEGAVESFKLLSKKYDVYILSTSPWENLSAWSDKLEWVKKHLGNYEYKRLILTHHKNLNKRDFLIADRTKNEAGDFDGELILYGSDEYPDWDSVVHYFINKESL